jgi:hypothetical protein
MNQLWLNAGRILAVAAAMLLVGCGPSKASREPGKTQSDADYKAEMAKQEAAMMGNQKPAAPKEDKGAAEGKQETEKPQEEKPADKVEAKQ